MNNNRGVTLLELIIAISLLTLIIFAGSSIYLSGMNLSLGAQYATQAHRNAQLAMMHMQINVSNAASNFKITDDGRTVQFMAYSSNPPDFSKDPSRLMQYSYDADLKQIIFIRSWTETQAITIVEEGGKLVDVGYGGGGGGESIVFNHIIDCNFATFQNDGVVLKIRIVADDNSNSGENIYKLNSNIEAGLTSAPAVYEII